MSRYTASLVCTHPGCHERDSFACDTRFEQTKIYRKHATHLCTRHRKPDEVLSTEQQQTEYVLINRNLTYDDHRGNPEAPLGRFWVRDGQKEGGSGFTYGPGFKAWSKDFPEGTRLVVTTRVEIPNV